ncbi:MAG TPA: class I SAM-dependent methyltransferase [Nitrospira sp.]|nr:class I SAM-dependent methyltransferase [Nitrospira sp.]
MTFAEAMIEVRKTSSHTALSDEEARVLYDAMAGLQSQDFVIEIGSQLGRSSVLITQMALSRGFHSIHVDPFCEQDVWAHDFIKRMCEVRSDRDRAFTFLCMRTDQARDILDQLHPIQLIYVDGDHTYAGVKTDLEFARVNLVEGGYLLCHDYGRESLPDVYKAVSEFLSVNPDFTLVAHEGTMGCWRRG